MAFFPSLKTRVHAKRLEEEEEQNKNQPITNVNNNKWTALG